MKKIEITISKDGIKVLGDRQELITPKTISITMEGEEEQPTPAPEPQPKSITYNIEPVEWEDTEIET